MLTWAMVQLVKTSHDGVPGVLILLAMVCDVAMVIAPVAIIWGPR